MKIKITLDKNEVKEILKDHALKTFPMTVKDKKVYVLESYGNFVVEIEDKIEDEEEKELITSLNEIKEN